MDVNAKNTKLRKQINVQVKFNMNIQYMSTMHYKYDGLCIIYVYYAVTNVYTNVKTSNN